MPDLLEQGKIFFNDGRYFEAHEVWEDLWRETAGPSRLLYQGLIQAAVGMHHRSQNNIIGARAQLNKALSKLGQYPANACGFDLARLCVDLRQVLTGLDFGGNLSVRIERLKSDSDVVESDGSG